MAVSQCSYSAKPTIGFPLCTLHMVLYTHGGPYTRCVKIYWPTLTCYNFDKGLPIFIIFPHFIHKGSVKEARIKTPLPLNLLLHYLVKYKWLSIQLYIHISENSMLHVSRHLLYEFLFVYLYFLPDTDVIMTLVQYFVCCLTHSFKL